MDSMHQVKVVRIMNIIPHPNADRLEIVKIDGYQCVVGKGQFKIGDLAVYVQPDSITPDTPQFKFVWERDGGGNPRELPADGQVPEKWRRITVRKLRKEYSEGLLMPVTDFPDNFVLPNGEIVAVEGEDVAEELGITHYNPPEPDETPVVRSSKQFRKWPRSFKGWIWFLSYWLSFGLYNPNGGTHGYGNEKAPENPPPVYDVEALKNYSNVFQEGEQVIVTEKIHGSNARYTYRNNFLGKGKMYAGSRRLWKRSKDNIWRKVLEVNPDIEEWCIAHPGYALFGEVVPTQAGFDYGATKDKPRFFLFDILSPEGVWLDMWGTDRHLILNSGIETVPPCYGGPFDMETISKFVEGPSLVTNKHIREGVVIRTQPERHVTGLGRAQLKLISNAYYEKDKV